MSEADLPSADEALAIDVALGALDRDALAAARRRQASDPGFARLCDEWAARLAPLAEGAAPVAPSPDLFARIEAALRTPAAFPRERPGLWRSLAFWRSLALASSAAAALLAVLLAVRDPVATPARAPVADAGLTLATALGGEGRPPIATAALDRRGEVVVVPTGLEGGEGRVPELWLIPGDGRPRSLGILRLGGAQRVKVPPTLLTLVAEGTTLAVSLEPVGGSPTGLPTGPVVATGTLSRV